MENILPQKDLNKHNQTFLTELETLMKTGGSVYHTIPKNKIAASSFDQLRTPRNDGLRLNCEVQVSAGET